MTHIYAFGSLCRGDFEGDSDVDLLAVVDSNNSRFNPDIFSVYSYERIKDLWSEGNPFAWHLAKESKVIYMENGKDFIKSLGRPNLYKNRLLDCSKFYDLFCSSCDSIAAQSNSFVFDLSTLFLAIRNFATCFSVSTSTTPIFSRYSALSLGEKSAPLSRNSFNLLLRARILSTRGQGNEPSRADAQLIMKEVPLIKAWMLKLLREIEHERI